MLAQWPIWLFGGLVLLAAGFAATYLPAVRARAGRRATAWSSARAAIASATVSRDASSADVAEATRLLALAEAITAEGGGVRAAMAATEHARQADRLWQEACGG